MSVENSSSHALITMISRCLSGQWLIEPNWLLQHSDLILRADKGDDMSKLWPTMESNLLVQSAGAFAAAGKDETIGKGQALGVINLVGPVYKYSTYYATSSKNLVSMLAQLANDSRVGGVKLIVDSPGGMLHGTREAYEAVLNFPKPILAVVDGYCASAMYYMVAGSNRIVATQPSDQIGSIGTYRTIADWNKYYASFGLDIFDIYAKGSSQKNEEVRQFFESGGKNSELMQKQLTVYNDQFISDVKAGRGDRLTGKGQDPMEGRIFFPNDAIENGIIDEQISDSETLGLLSDMVATNKQSTIQMSNSKFSTFLTAMGNLVKSANDEQETPEGAAPTVEQLSNQITELTSARDQALGQVTTLTTERDAAAASVATLTNKVTELEGKIEVLGEQPGAMGTKVSKAKDEIPKGDGGQQTLRQVIDDLETEKEAAAMGF
ncbi:MAG: S49 family peptidase [Dyadobacter sp.]|uniref:S49 family peptidase n=1 Tax=Dyadobacter sp. TaxID=1914288 RepID=UPI0032668834